MKKKALVWDRGLYLFLAEKLGETYDKVWYYYPQSEPYPRSQTSMIGTGLEKVERVYDFWPYVDKADTIVFFDCYDGELQHFLHSKGYHVFGSMRSEIFEMDKSLFYQFLMNNNMPVPRTYRAEGLDDLVKHLESVSGERWLKTSYYRGDFETHRFHGMKHAKPWIDDLRARIGGRSDTIEILCQSPVDSIVEIGYDGFCVDGNCIPCMVGYEAKDKGYIGKTVSQTAEPLDKFNRLFFPAFKEIGYRGHFSTEVRVAKNGDGYFIDPTCRAPSPPSELMCEMLDYAKIVDDISQGIVPAPVKSDQYGAEIILKSEWSDKHELCVEFAKEHEKNIKLKNHYVKDGTLYIVPNENAGYFGAVIAMGSTPQEAIKKCLEVYEQVEADDLDNMSHAFDGMDKITEMGKKYGIEF